jgi:hypothetical protein
MNARRSHRPLTIARKCAEFTFDSSAYFIAGQGMVGLKYGRFSGTFQRGIIENHMASDGRT